MMNSIISKSNSPISKGYTCLAGPSTLRMSLLPCTQRTATKGDCIWVLWELLLTSPCWLVLVAPPSSFRAYPFDCDKSVKSRISLIIIVRPVFVQGIWLWPRPSRNMASGKCNQIPTRIRIRVRIPIQNLDRTEWAGTWRRFIIKFEAIGHTMRYPAARTSAVRNY